MTALARLEKMPAVKISRPGPPAPGASEVKLRTAVVIELSTELQAAGTDSTAGTGDEPSPSRETVVLTVYIPHCRLHPTRVQIVEV